MSWPKGAGAFLANWLALDDVPGVGLMLMEACGKLGCEARFAVGIGAAVEDLYKRLGFEVSMRVPRWAAVVDEGAAENLVAAANPQARREDVQEICCRFAAAQDEHGEDLGRFAAHQPGGRFGDEWDACWRDCFAPRIVGAARDSAYLNWRYKDHPTFRYERVVALDQQTKLPAGLAVYRIEEVRDTDLRVLRIVEFLGEGAAGAALAGGIITAARKAGVALADFYCTSHSAARPLEEAGFKLYEPAAETLGLPGRFQPLDGSDDTIRGAFWLDPQLKKETGSLLARPDFYVTKSDDDMDRPN